MLSPKKSKTPVSKKLILWLTVVAGIALAVWGGWLVYNRTKSTANTSITTEVKTTPVQPPDTIAKNNTDTVSIAAKDMLTPAGSYKFVIEEATRTRALSRYADLKKWGINVQMETRDSVNFKLFFQLAALPADTARIKDSLGLLYSAIGKTRIDQ